MPQPGHRWIFVIGAFLGLSGVIIGAALDHISALVLLQPHSADIAVRYQQWHAAIITMLGLALCYLPLPSADRQRLAVSAKILIAGIMLFCAALYTHALTGSVYAAHGAPLGGITLIIGWAALMRAALRQNIDA